MLSALCLLAFLSPLFLPAAQANEGEQARDRQGVHWGGLPVFNYSSDLGLSIGGFARRFDYGGGSPQEKSDDNPPEEEKPASFENLWTLQFTHAQHGPNIAFANYELTGVSRYHLRLFTQVLSFQNDHQPYFGLGEHSVYDRALAGSGVYQYFFGKYEITQAVRKNIVDNVDLELSLAVSSETQKPIQELSQFSTDFGNLKTHHDHPKLGVSLIMDKRDSEFIPSKGYRFSGALISSPALAQDAPHWARADLDARAYYPFISSRWLWFAIQLHYAQSSEDTPLQDKAKLGSFGTLRGLPLGRYSSNNALTARAEIRSVVIRMRIFDMPLKVGSGVFVDTGKIGASLGEIRNNPFHKSAGVSIIGSYFTDDFVGTTDIAFSEGGYAYYLTLGHAF